MLLCHISLFSIFSLSEVQLFESWGKISSTWLVVYWSEINGPTAVNWVRFLVREQLVQTQQTNIVGLVHGRSRTFDLSSPRKNTKTGDFQVKLVWNRTIKMKRHGDGHTLKIPSKIFHRFRRSCCRKERVGSESNLESRRLWSNTVHRLHQLALLTLAPHGSHEDPVPQTQLGNFLGTLLWFTSGRQKELEAQKSLLILTKEGLFNSPART